MATIDTLPATNISGTSATLQFEILDDGNPDGCESWSANIGYKPHSSETWIWLNVIMGAGEGILQQSVSGLLPDTQYDVTSRITNAAGTAYGDVETFWIEVELGLPVVTTLEACNITHYSAELELLVVDDGDPSIVTGVVTMFTYWCNEEQPKTTEMFMTTESEQSSFMISGLEPETTYWFYAEAINSVGQVTGETLGFKTLPDPNSVPVAFDSNEPDTLIIQNFVKVLQTDLKNPHDNQGIVSYMEKTGNFSTLDSNDILFSKIPGTIKSSKIVSLIPDTNNSEEIDGFYELYKDARPELNDPNNLTLLELSIYSASNGSYTTSQNSLKFWIFDDTNSLVLDNCFNGKPLTLQQISSDPNEPNLVYPLWDIRKVIENNGRQIALDELNDQKPNVPYAFFELSTTKELLDINEDGTIDSNDYSCLLEDFGKTGIFRSDIASEKGSGLPDGIVDVNDEVTFITEYNKLYPENPVPNPYVDFAEDFESGNIQEPFTSSGDIPWIIDSSSYSGEYSIKSGGISDSQTSILEANLNTSSQKVSFYFKVSSESGCDNLIFEIDGIEAGRWSGRLEWQKAEFLINPGIHNFAWIYNKDESLSDGLDCVWIDKIEFALY